MAQGSIFHFILIKPSHYDNDGYVIQWARSILPSNSLACVYGLVMDCAERQIFGSGVEVKISAFDETNARIKPKRLARQLKAPGVTGLVGFVGVQSNQFPRALDLARQFRVEGVQVCIGGFHVSGCIAMLPGIQPDLQEAMDLGISLFAGEAEGRMDQLLRDAYNGEMQPLYNYMNNLPDISHTPTPYLPPSRIKRNLDKETTFDAGRGCPFLCSFCTIINIQGRKSRRRSVDDIERIIRANAENEVYYYFITDDNFARNQDWEVILDRLIYLREVEGMPLKLILQVDTMCHKIPNFIVKAGRAGVHKIFVGLENINPDSLAGAKKKQNRITEYRPFFQAWRAQGVITYAGYILGFPNDTPETIERDIEIIKRELPIDILEFFFLTPLPGSADHKRLFDQKIPMDPDMNNYDLIHATTEHPRMTKTEWEGIYERAYDLYFCPEHVKTLMYRAKVMGIAPKRIGKLALLFYASHLMERIHPMESGVFRRKYRRDRRPSMPRENPLIFYPKYVFETMYKIGVVVMIYWRHRRLAQEVENDPKADQYTDIAISPTTDSELDQFEMFNSTEAARSAIKKVHKKRAA